jgi:hypothetical protein
MTIGYGSRMTNGERMSSPSPKPQDKSSRQYERLLKGQIDAKQYVQSLKEDARSRVRRVGKTGRAAA